MPGYQDTPDLYPGPDMAKAQQLMAQANPSDKDITVGTDDEPDRKRIGEYYQDVLNQLGFHTTLKVIGGDVYFDVIGNGKTPDLDTGFDDWFEDYPHPNDCFQPLLDGNSILPTNNQNHSYTNIPALNKEIADLGAQQLHSDDVVQKYAELDKKFMEQAPVAPYGNERYSIFTSDRINFDNVDWSLVMSLDYSSLQLTG